MMLDLLVCAAAGGIRILIEHRMEDKAEILQEYLPIIESNAFKEYSSLIFFRKEIIGKSSKAFIP